MGRSVRRGGEGCGLKLIRYQPLRSQAQFHRSKARFKGFSGPIGSGKSQALCQEAIRLAFVNGGTMGLLGAPTYPMLRDATRRALLSVLEANEIPFAHHKSDSIVEFTQNGSKILLRSLDEYERLRGTNLAWFGIDELTYCKEDAWLRLEGRLREPKAVQHCGFAVWTPKGKDWVYRRFVEDRNPEYDVTFATRERTSISSKPIPGSTTGCSEPIATPSTGRKCWESISCPTTAASMRGSRGDPRRSSGTGPGTAAPVVARFQCESVLLRDLSALWRRLVRGG